MKTRKTCWWLMFAACLFLMGSTQVMAEDTKKEDEKVSIPISTTGPFNGGEHRGLVSAPFDAYYQVGAIYISTSAEFSMITITVDNKTTGQTWNVAADISDGMGEICIANGGAGSYTVEIVTEYGDCFVGSFSL